MRKIMICMAILLMCGLAGEGRKKGFKLDYDKKEAAAQTKKEKLTTGSFMVASQCTDCNKGYKLDQIVFSGYDKPQQSSVETFFITNNTDRTMTGVNLYIDYRMPDGRQLNKRFYQLTCLIPPGETRQAEITSWDKQHSFVYEKSAASKRGGTPYTVTFDPISFYLRF